VFTHAATDHAARAATIGIGRKAAGSGCAIAPRLTLTADHVLRNAGNSDLIAFADTLEPRACKVVYRNPSHDIAILESDGDVTNRGPCPVRFEWPPLGTSVGFYSRLKMGGKDVPYFAQAAIASYLYEPEPLSLGLSGVILQFGFSGSAVFDTQGRIAGVLIQRRTAKGDLPGEFLQLGVVAPMFPLKDALATFFQIG
jgi:hypothetical protein